MRERAGVVGKFVEMPAELADRFKAFCDARGVKFGPEVCRALERHLAYPPGPPAPPPPPDPFPGAGVEPATKPRGKRK